MIRALSIFACITCLHLFCSTAAATTCETILSKNQCFKIGQMMIVGFGGLKQQQGKITWQDVNGATFKEDSNIAKNIKDLHVGGVIFFEKPFFNEVTGRFLQDRNIQNPTQVRTLIDSLQSYNTKVNKQAKPLIVSVDEEGGMVERLPFSRGFSQRYPIPQSYGANEERFANNKQRQQSLLQTRKIATAMAKELADLHFNVDFAPSVDVNINPLNPIIGAMGRSFSADPKIVVSQAQQFINAFHAQGIIPVIKHFPGHGSTSKDSHEGLVITTDYIKDKELLPYRELIQRGYHDIIMTTHVINGRIDKTQCKLGAKNDPSTWCPATLSYATLTELLRNQLGFKGVIVSDDMMMGAIAKQYSLEAALEKGINAGIDMFIISNNDADNTDAMITTIARLVKSGRVKMSRIDEAYNRIVTLKQKISGS